jgi:uncharacterized membrane protein
MVIRDFFNGALYLVRLFFGIISIGPICVVIGDNKKLSEIH